MYFSINWTLLGRCKNNSIKVEITFIDKDGICEKHIKFYKEWIGVCTNDIDKVVKDIKNNFPNHVFEYEYLSETKKILPYLDERLANNELYNGHLHFYKLYSSASYHDICLHFNCYEISYFDPSDWLVRIYIDLCTLYNTYSFYYKWYEVQKDSENLLDSLKMVSDCRDEPNWTILAFDIETVPLVGNHIPIGFCESDRIVMMSVFKWNKKNDIQKWLLYVLPTDVEPCEPKLDYEYAFKTESEMLIHFHSLLDNVQVITGYNINEFDLQCIFNRLVHLNLIKLLVGYTSLCLGSDTVIIYKNKITIDLYTYFKIFSSYNLPSFKLDDVARIKLDGEKKLPLNSTGIWSWYRNPSLVLKLWKEEKVEKCFNLLKPKTVSKSSEFGTFRMYLDYCLKDSELVHCLFEKEYVLSFLVERANFTGLNCMEVLHYGNSRYLLELFKTYGTCLGFFMNPKFFATNLHSKYEILFKGKTYQGALNFCYPEHVYEDVSVMDFSSMYPSTLLSSNLCYSTCSIMTREEWLSNKIAQNLTSIPYRTHSDIDFMKNSNPSTSTFSYPKFDPEIDDYAIVINMNEDAFLPKIVSHFIKMRQYHQKEWKQTKDIYHYNVQLGIKILINSLYGVMANKESCLAYLPIAMTIVTLSRYQLLGSYHYLKEKGYDVCYADTDSLMVHKWPVENCDLVNNFLNLPHVELKYEQRMKRLLVLSKKRYIYENNTIVTKGFQKKINGLVEFMTEKILNNVWQAIFQDSSQATFSQGWIVWVDTILEANYRCRDPKKYSIYRKVKTLEEYKSETCPSVKYLKKYPEKNQEHVEFTYSIADIALRKASNWVVDVEDCLCVNFEQLFISQKKIYCTLLNMAYWHLSDPTKPTNMILNNLHWKRFVLAELLHWHATKKRIVLLIVPGVKYTFTINDHLKGECKRGRKRKINL